MKYILTDSILQLLKSRNQPLRLYDIARLLNIKSSSPRYADLRNAVNFLVTEGKVISLPKRRYVLNQGETDIISNSYFQGKIEIKDERGTVFDTISKLKITIKHRHLNTALHGDIVEIRILANVAGKKQQGEVAAIVKRAERKILGTIEWDGYFYFLVPDDEHFYVDFLIPKACLNNAKPGDKVSASFIKWDNPTKSPEACVDNILGKAGTSTVEYDSIPSEFGLNESFPESVESESKQVYEESKHQDYSQRLDLRKDQIITIDPDDAKDFDDALSLKIDENGIYHLGVHIADVSYYIKAGGHIDVEALNRGNSTYLVDRVVPMLPEILSNDLCSLKPNRIRMAFSVIMDIGPDMTVRNYQISESAIKSCKRFTYAEVLNIIETGSGPLSGLILNLHELAEKLKNKRLKQGGINFETSELRFKLDENKFPQSAVLKATTAATSLVEECMLLANKTVATHIKKLTKTYKQKELLPFIYRVHDVPNPDKLKTILDFILLMGHKGSAHSGSAKAINNLLAQFEDRPEKSIVHQMLVRAMPKAEYSPDNIGHYGLGFTDYTHFTSPIRRYPDLLVHRLIKEYNASKPDIRKIKTLTETIAYAAERCTTTERNSMDAERASVKIASCLLSSAHVGESYDGTISGVTSFGLFVILDNLYSEGLLHIRDLVDDYYEFDEANFRLVGKRKKRIYRFGGRIKVKIIRVNIDKRKIDLAFADK